jgi:hypothetical protein
MVNRVDKLSVEIPDISCLRQYSTFNKLMNSFVLRINFGTCKATIQFFPVKNSAMCFTSNFSNTDFLYLFALLRKKYGVGVKLCALCTTVWKYSNVRVGDLNRFYNFLSMQFPNLEMDLTVEIFPCITLVYVKPSLKATTLRVFHTGKVILLGVTSSNQLSCVVDFIATLFADFFTFTRSK